MKLTSLQLRRIIKEEVANVIGKTPAATLKELTMADIEKIYKAARNEFGASFAMLSDDAYNGARKAAKKFGIAPYVDAGWFPVMLGYIQRHAPWERVSPENKEKMLELANEDVEYEISHPRKKYAPKKPIPI